MIPEPIKQSIENMKRNYNVKTISSSDYENLSTSQIEFIGGYVFKTESQSNLIGYFFCKNKYYCFWYDINKKEMTTLEEIIIKYDDKHSFSYMIKKDTSFGKMAFWKYTPLSYIKTNGTNEDILLRKYMRTITDYITSFK